MSDLGLVIVKPPYAGNYKEENIFHFINDYLLGFNIKNKSYVKLKHNILFDNKKEFTRKLYGDIREWKGLDEMIEFFDGKLFRVLIYGEHPKLPGFMKKITGRTKNETNIETIRGMMRSIFGTPEKEYLNVVHVPYPHELENHLNILKELNIFDYKNAVD